MNRADWWESEPKSVEVTIKVLADLCEGGKVMIEGSCQCPTTLPVFDGKKCVEGSAPLIIDVPEDEGGFKHNMRADESFTLKETKPDGKDKFTWGEIQGTDTYLCLGVVDKKEEGNTRQITFKPIKDNCEEVLKRDYAD
jgi:hypothetical protein